MRNNSERHRQRVLGIASIARSNSATAKATFWQATVAPAIRARIMSPTLQNTRAQRDAAPLRSSSSIGHFLSAGITKRTLKSALGMSAFGGKADMPFCAAHVCF